MWGGQTWEEGEWWEAIQAFFYFLQLHPVCCECHMLIEVGQKYWVCSLYIALFVICMHWRENSDARVEHLYVK